MKRKSTQHGSVYAYEHGCRCEKCLAGHARRHLRQRAARNPEDAPKHGTVYAYIEYNCRCEECRAANTEAAAALRARRNAKRFSPCASA